VEAVNNLFNWSRNSDECPEDAEHVVCASGAFIIAWWSDDDGARKVYRCISFPTEAMPFDEPTLLRQAEFAMDLINLTGQNMDVILNGEMIEDVIRGKKPRSLLREYRAAIGTGAEPVIPEIVDIIIERAQRELDLLRAWRNKPVTLLPPGMEVLSIEEGIVALALTDPEDEEAGSDYVAIAGDLPEDFINSIRDDVL
jgi:hypothetical protein